MSLGFGPMILSGAAIRFFIVYELSPAARAEGLAQLTTWLDQGRLQHAVGRVLPLADIVAAHEAVEAGAVMGNVVLTC
jgi:NADPH:quinone reductase-like Zn-dependent oxidoreductase